jgi:hypothetical protein
MITKNDRLTPIRTGPKQECKSCNSNNLREGVGT